MWQDIKFMWHDIKITWQDIKLMWQDIRELVWGGSYTFSEGKSE